MLEMLAELTLIAEKCGRELRKNHPERTKINNLFIPTYTPSANN